ncbi:MAG: hypothetical protein ABGX83_10880 [Nitrospira sp.]|nr:hypothetical protein [Candidatus Manganitrophaceae bacterium]HIL34569.1 hypothetical protein [Candidatus Manganitrophaceae bacterium]
MEESGSDKEETRTTFSVNEALNAWLKLGRRLLSRKSWKKDVARGMKRLQTAGTSVVERSFEEVELVRLRYRLEKIDQELFEAYHLLGKKCLDHWMKGRSFIEVERKRECRRIHQIDEDKKKILNQMRELKESSNEDIGESVPPK